MTFGGKIEKGETPFKAAKRELFEESGLKVNLKFKEIIKTTEQKHYVYEAIVNKRSIQGQLKAQASEVTGFKWIKPPRYTGATALQPFGRKATRFGLDKRIVRAEDLTILSKSRYPSIVPTKLVSNIPKESFMRRSQATFLKQRVQKFEWTKPSTYGDKLFGRKAGQFKKFQQTAGQEYGFGSRYDIPYSKLKTYEGKKLTYVHGSSREIKTQLDFISKGGMPKGFKQIKVESYKQVEAKYFKRGEKVLFFQPPTTASPLTARGYVGLTYLGLYKKQRASYGMGISFKRKSPTIHEYKGELGKDMIATQKAIKGKEFETGVTTGTTFGVGSYSKTYLSGKKVKIVEITKAKTPKQTKQLQKSLKEGMEQEHYIKVQKRPVRYSEVISHSSSRFIYSPSKYKSYGYDLYRTIYRTTPDKTPTLTYSYDQPTSYKITPAMGIGTGVLPLDKYPTPSKSKLGIPPIIRVTSTRVKTTLKPQLKPQPKKYQASLRSKAFGITATKISGAYKIGAGGIATRPIIKVKKKKKNE